MLLWLALLHGTWYVCMCLGYPGDHTLSWQAVFERTLEENLAVTGVLSSLCLAATAAEVSPVRRLLLVLLFDGTQDAPFRRWTLARADVFSCKK